VLKYTFKEFYAVPDGNTYSIVVYIDNQDNNQFNDTLKIKRTAGHTDVKNATQAHFELNQNIPNPARDITQIYYNIPVDGTVRITVYSANGQSLFVYDEEAKSGENILRLPVSDLASGIYFYTMEYQQQRIVRKMSIQR
jgi:hypothetical protein